MKKVLFFFVFLIFVSCKKNEYKHFDGKYKSGDIYDFYSYEKDGWKDSLIYVGMEDTNCSGVIIKGEEYFFYKITGNHIDSLNSDFNMVKENGGISFYNKSTGLKHPYVINGDSNFYNKVAYPRLKNKEAQLRKSCLIKTK